MGYKIKGEVSNPGKTYYVSPTGSDSNDGRTQGGAWQTIAKVNAGTYQPGDKILFQGGKTFASTTGIILTTTNCPAGGGTSTNPITIGSYGKGKATLYSTIAACDGIRTTNLQYVTVKNLIILGSNAGTFAEYYGVVFVTTGTTYQYGCHVESCDISYFGNAGILWLGGAPVASGFSDCHAIDCNISRCVRWGIFSGNSNNTPLPISNPTGEAYRTHRNLYIANCHVHDCIGDSAYGGNNTGSGIVLLNAIESLIEYCLVHDCGGGGSSGGGACGIWFCYCSTSIIQYCEVYNIKTNSPAVDGNAYDIDLDSDNCIVQYCYGHDCDGAGMLFCITKGGNVARYNLFVNNASSWGAEVYVFNCVGSQKVYGNTILGRDGFYIDSVESLLEVSNNLVVVRTGFRIAKISELTAPTTAFLNNDYWELGGSFKVTHNNVDYNSLEVWRTAKGQEILGGVRYGYFGNPHLAKSFTDTTTGTVYAPFGIANKKETGFYPTASHPALCAKNLAFDMGGIDLNQNTISQPLAGKAVGAIAKDLSPVLLLSGATTGVLATELAYSLWASPPVAGGTIVVTPSATGGGTITPTTVNLTSAANYQATFTVNWTADGAYSVGATATGYPAPSSVSVSVVDGSLHPDTTNWKTRVESASGTVPSSKLSAVDTAVRYAYANGLRTSGSDHKIHYLLVLGATNGYAGCNVPIWDDGAGNATLNYASDDWTTSGLLGNGSSKYINTGWIPSAHLASTGCIFEWATQVALPVSGYVIFGAGSAGGSRLDAYWSAVDIGGEIFDNSALYTDAHTDPVGLLLVNKPGSMARLLGNNSLWETNETFGTPPTAPLYFGAYNNNGTAANFYANRILAVGAGKGLTTSEEAALYTMLGNLKTGIGA